MSTIRVPETGRLADIVTTADLLAAGISAAQIRAAVRCGDLIRLDRGIYVSARRATSAGGRKNGQLALRAAAVLAPLGPHAVASHHTAAQLLGLDLLGRIPAEIAITRVPGSGSAKSWPGVSVHRAKLPDGQRDQRNGVPITAAARTVLDLARASSFMAGVVLADSALRLKRTTKPDLHAVLESCRRWPGARRAADVATFADPLSESPLESIARVAFRNCGLPVPELQALLGTDDRIIARVDFYWKQFRTVAEADGKMKYDNRFEATYQLRRDADLRDAGYEVVHFGWDEIFSTPMQVAESIQAAFRRGSRAYPAPGPAA